MSLSNEFLANIIKISTKEELRQTVKRLRIMSYNNRGNDFILGLVLQATEKGSELG